MNCFFIILNRKFRLLTALAFLLLFSVSAAFAQQTGALGGQVTDELGGAVAGSEVAITDENGKTKKSVTDKTGNYSFKNLTPGTYSLQVASTDFALFETKEVLVTAGRAQSFDVRLKLKEITESVAVDDGSTTKSQPGSNFGDVTLREKEVADLPDDPEALAAALKAMAPLGPGEPQILVDGFTAENPPPKQTIREVRISQNNFSAEDDRPGGSRIQIFTKSGLDKLQGNAFFNWSDESLNARNPFAEERAPYLYRQYGFSLSGTLIPKKGSFFLNFQKLDENQNGIVSAQTLDGSLNLLPLNLSFIIPRRNYYFNPRLDFQLSKNHSLTLRYGYSQSAIKNLGVGELSLPERGYDYRNSQHIFQATETAVINPQTVNEFRLQYVRTALDLSDTNSTPGINVQGAFLAGGAGIGLSSNESERFELQNYVTTNTKNHLMRFGVRLRALRLMDTSPGNFNGAFTFAGGSAPVLDSSYQIVLDSSGQPLLTQITSLERYRRTLLLQGLGFSAAAIRLRGGGASQFSIAQGNPEVKIEQMDFGAFFQDEWRLKPNLNIYLGLRYENQTNLDDNLNFAPRAAFAWVPKIGKENTTIRGGLGLYYERFSEQYTLQAQQFGGSQIQRIISSDPNLVDFFPHIPSSSALQSFLNRQTTTKIADDIKAARTFVSLINFEHKFSSKHSVYAGLSTYRTRHSVRQRNINAPLPGTYIFGEPASGIHPFGDIGEIFLVESSNEYLQNQFYAGFRSQMNSAVSISASYLLSDTKDAGAAGAFPADSYNLQSEWGRASAFSIRHRLYLNGRIEIPKMKVTFTPQVIVFSQRPFNITTGLDANGDQIFAERPSFAAEAATGGLNIYNTPFGVFNIIPLAGERVIPRNIGRGSAFFSVNAGISKTFGFGSFGKTNAGAKNSSDKPYKITLSMQIQNLFNNVNFGTFIGNLSSPLFGKATRTVSAYGFEDGSPAYNRRIEAQIRFSF
jgi:hypothetical protein